MKSDLHCHTFFSPCANPAMTVQAMVEAAEGAGLAGLGFTDHPHRPGLAQHHLSLRHALDSVESPVRFWIGAELEVARFQRLVIEPRALPHADYLIAAPSHYDLIHFPPVPNLEDPAEWADRLMTDLENVPGSGAQGIAHPFYVYSILVEPPRGMVLPLMAEILAELRPKRVERWLEKCAESNVALEISPRIYTTDVFAGFVEGVYQNARRIGCRFFTGSDAHRLERIGSLGRAVDLPGKLGLTEDDLWFPGKPD